MSQSLKLFLNVIHQRIYKTCKKQLSHCQFGFQNFLGTRVELFCLQVLFQRVRAVYNGIFACFINYQKAFDKVQHDNLIQVLKVVGKPRLINYGQLLLKSNHHQSVLKVQSLRKSQTEEGGMRQRCVLSPLMYNVHSAYIFREVLENNNGGLFVNG